MRTWSRADGFIQWCVFTTEIFENELPVHWPKTKMIMILLHYISNSICVSWSQSGQEEMKASILFLVARRKFKNVVLFLV